MPAFLSASRLSTALALAAVACSTVPVLADSRPGGLDGRRNTTMSYSAETGPQAAAAPLVDAGPTGVGVVGDSAASCRPPRCHRQPVRITGPGRVGALRVDVAWQSPSSDINVYLLNPRGEEVAHCGASAGGTEASVLLSATNVASGVYTVVTIFRLTAGDRLTGVVKYPGRALATSVTDLDRNGCPTLT